MTEIDWSSAEVDGGRLTAALTGKPSSEWIERVHAVIERLQRTGGAWGDIKFTRKKLRVDAVTAGSEADLRHFLESAVLQANAAEHDDTDEPSDDDDRSPEDQQMTDAFRSFGDR